MMAGYADVVVLRHPESTAIAVNVSNFFVFAVCENIERWMCFICCEWFVFREPPNTVENPY